MSDRPQGEGWWLASDGKWYPPESHPSAGQQAPAQPPQPQYQPPVEPPASSGPPGDGWWMASDGNWYPPDARPGTSMPPPGATPGFEHTVAYAGFWRRFVAILIDGIIAGLVIFTTTSALGMNEASVNVVSFVAQWLYFAFAESSEWQATLGKKAMGIIVTDVNGHRISFGRATGRYFGKVVSAIILMIGFVMAAFTRRKQALHDIMAECLVVVQ